MLSEASDRMAFILKKALERGVHEIEVTVEAERNGPRPSSAPHAGSAPSSQNAHPATTTTKENSARKARPCHNSYGKGPSKFFQITSQWRADGNFVGLDMRP